MEILKFQWNLEISAFPVIQWQKPEGERDSLLNFAKHFGKGFKVMLCKILRSPLKNNRLGCFIAAFESLYQISENRKAPSFESAFDFGGRRGIRS